MKISCTLMNIYAVCNLKLQVGQCKTLRQASKTNILKYNTAITSFKTSIYLCAIHYFTCTDVRVCRNFNIGSDIGYFS